MRKTGTSWAGPHLLKLLVLSFLSSSKHEILKIISKIRGGGSKNSSIQRRRRPWARNGGSKWGRRSKRSWLLVLGSWYPWKQQIITHQSSTQPQYPMIMNNQQQKERVLFGGRRRTGQFWSNICRDCGIQHYMEFDEGNLELGKDPITWSTVVNCLKSIGSKPIIYDNKFLMRYWALLSESQIT